MILNLFCKNSCKYAALHKERPSERILHTALLSLLAVAIVMMPKTGFGTSPDIENLSHFEMNSMKKNAELTAFDNDDTLYVKEFLLAEDVIEREPVAIVDSYTMADARAWCFARIHNSEDMQDVYFKWFYEDELYFEMNSKIGTSPNWRTYSSVGLQPGSWRVTLEDNRGNILDEMEFFVSE